MASRRARCTSNYGHGRWNCRREKTRLSAPPCLIARELGAPDDVKPIEWRSLSNRAVDTLAAAVDMVNWYRARWEIEILLFNVLKTAYKVEELQLGSMARIERALALFMVDARRIA